MRRTVWPLALLTAASVIAAGMVISASSEAQERPKAKTVRPADRWDGRLGTPLPSGVEAPVIETIKISGDQAGNKRYPGVAENANGDRLVIFRGHDDTYWYSFYKKNGAWSTPASIPGQPALDNYTCVDVEVDSSGRFHCVWDEPGSVVVYGSFLDGAWTTPFMLQNIGGYDMGPSIAVRSNDDVLIATGQVINAGYLTKDVFLHVKGKTESQFRTPKNLTNDHESSCQAWIAVDANDHTWMVHKSDLDWQSTVDILVIYLTHWDENNNAVDDWQLVSTSQGFSFWPQVAVNSAGKVMTAWAYVQGGDYWSRLYDPATKNMSARVPLEIGLSTNPWCTFWSKLVAHGEDFYIAAMNPGRILYLLKFDEQTSQWDQIAQISDKSVQYFDLYSGSDKMLIAWGENDDPADVFLTTVEVSGIITDRPTLRIQSSAGGTTAPVPGSYHYDKGSSVTIRALPAAGYQLSSWSGDASGTATTITVTMDRDLTVKANFSAIPKSKLTIQSSAGGTTDPSPGSYSYDKGTSVTIRAIQDAGYRLSSWEGDASGNAASITVTMDRDLTVKANFAFIPVPKPPLDPVMDTALEASRTDKTNTLTWQGNPENSKYELKEYWIYRKRANMSDSDFTKIGSVSWGILRYADRGLPLNQKFTYVLTTIPLDPYGKESARSEPVTEISAFPPLSAACKTVINYSLFRKEKINRISWQKNPLNEAVTIAQYNIYRKRTDQDDSAYKLIGSVTGSSVEYQDRRLSFSESYMYVIRAVDSGGTESGTSNPARE